MLSIIPLRTRAKRRFGSLSMTYFFPPSQFLPDGRALSPSRWWDLDIQDWSSFQEWLSWFQSIRLPVIVKSLLEGVFAVAWWSIWRFRNRTIFEENSPKRSVVFDDIVRCSFNWCNSRCRRRSTDVVGMALPVQNINHSAFRSMFEKEKLSGNNFNDWFARLKLVLRVEKKMHVIEQPYLLASWAVLNPNICGSELRSMFEKQAGVEKFDLIQSFHACNRFEEVVNIAEEKDSKVGLCQYLTGSKEAGKQELLLVRGPKGYEALVKRDTLDKLKQRSVKCIFIGYPKETMGYWKTDYSQ
ncbi:hypothetical protein Tco_1440476 [Tanacetum coccineum]